MINKTSPNLPILFIQFSFPRNNDTRPLKTENKHANPSPSQCYSSILLEKIRELCRLLMFSGDIEIQDWIGTKPNTKLFSLICLLFKWVAFISTYSARVLKFYLNIFLISSNMSQQLFPLATKMLLLYRHIDCEYKAAMGAFHICCFQ